MRQLGGKGSLSHRVFVALVTTCAVVAVVVTIASSFIYQSAFLADEHEQLAGECQTIASLLDNGEDDEEVLASINFGSTRVTLVAPDGTVAFDSEVDASELPNHSGRPEIVDALETGTGSSERSSETVGYVSVYEAVLLESGDVLRLSVDRASVFSYLADDLVVLFALGVFVIAGAWFVSRMVSRLLVKPILEIDPSAGDEMAPYEELDPLVDRLNEQHKELVQRMSVIQGADDMRREFTANVTHELKTPLASIQGAAELIRDGIAQPEDVPNFAGRIYKEAQRLTLLVNDILMLSKLDESERLGDRHLMGPSEWVDLLSVAYDVVERLAPKAKKGDVELLVEGISSPVRGNSLLLDELVSNLVENAIRYNKPGGKVFVWVLPQEGKPCIRVSDTGIGIPAEAQSKVFERFYRADKGRSRDMGGTGLGLAIVKHAAVYHGADIRLESTVGEGTDITVTFPIPQKKLPEELSED